VARRGRKKAGSLRPLSAYRPTRTRHGSPSRSYTRLRH
jgi:hypothetical protein